MENNHVIWSDLNLNFEDWREDLHVEYPGKSDDELCNVMYEVNADYLNNERTNLNIQLSTDIVVIADLGLWHGRRDGYKIIESGNIRDCLYSDGDISEWYVDKLGDMRCTDIHHDGRNYYLYRAFKEQLTDSQRDIFLGKIVNGKVTRADINRVTRRLGDEIGAVYGWSFPARTRRRESRQTQRADIMLER